MTSSSDLFDAIRSVRPACPISGHRGEQIHHCLIERGASGLPPRLQKWIDQPWNCVLLSAASHHKLHNFDPALNHICIQALIDFYGEEELEKKISEIPFRIKTSLSKIKARNRME